MQIANTASMQFTQLYISRKVEETLNGAMSHAVISLLLVFALMVGSLTQAVPAIEENDNSREELPGTARSTTDRFVLGSDYDGAVPIYSFQNTLTYDSVQPEVSTTIAYPDVKSDDVSTITQIVVYLEGNEGFESQAYVTNGGIGEQELDLEIVANNTDTLRYMVIIYGIKK